MAEERHVQTGSKIRTDTDTSHTYGAAFAQLACSDPRTGDTSPGPCCPCARTRASPASSYAAARTTHTAGARTHSATDRHARSSDARTRTRSGTGLLQYREPCPALVTSAAKRTQRTGARTRLAEERPGSSGKTPRSAPDRNACDCGEHAAACACHACGPRCAANRRSPAVSGTCGCTDARARSGTCGTGDSSAAETCADPRGNACASTGCHPAAGTRTRTRARAPTPARSACSHPNSCAATGEAAGRSYGANNICCCESCAHAAERCSPGSRCFCTAASEARRRRNRRHCPGGKPHKRPAEPADDGEKELTERRLRATLARQESLPAFLSCCPWRS